MTETLSKAILNRAGDLSAKIGYARTKEALAVQERRAKTMGMRLKLSTAQKKQVMRLRREGEHSATEIGAIFGVSRQTVYPVVGVCSCQLSWDAFEAVPTTPGAQS